MSAEKFDVVILGGGNAGIGVTGPVRRAGMSVAMIEPRDLGGTCPNRGCTPKKILVAAGHALHEIERASVHHIAVGKPKLDWAALIDREKHLIKDIPANLARAMAKRQVEVIAGQAAFAGPNTVRVGDRTLEGKHVVIATGSKPRPLPIPGAGHMITSDEMLSDRKLPSSVVFIGGGVISLEFGHVYARAGTEVTILEALPQLLPAMDADAVAQLQRENERIGIRVDRRVRQRPLEARREFLVTLAHRSLLDQVDSAALDVDRKLPYPTVREERHFPVALRLRFPACRHGDPAVGACTGHADGIRERGRGMSAVRVLGSVRAPARGRGEKDRSDREPVSDPHGAVPRSGESDCCRRRWRRSRSLSTSGPQRSRAGAWPRAFDVDHRKHD